MTIERKYDSKKKALAVNGKLVWHEGQLYRALSVKVGMAVSFADAWVAEVEVRPANEAEHRTAKLAELRKQLDHCRMAWSSDPDDTAAAANRAHAARLKAEIEALEAETATAN